ncbi:MAG: SMI1/KNR4 family protein [Mycobacterium sp.]
MVAVGWVQRSPWVVLLATPVFTVLYALGKWNAWKSAWRIGGGPQIGLSVLVTLPIQAVVAGVCYVLGVGLGRLVAGNRALAPLAAGDVIAIVLLLSVGTFISAVVIRLENAVLAASSVASTSAGLHTHDGADIEPEIELDVDPTPLTLDTFFVSPEHWRTNAAREALESRSGPVRKPPSAADDDMIVAAETRLGVRLPDMLRALYRKLNGGYVGWLYVPLVPNPGPVYDDWRGAFSIDYSSLASLDNLRTVAEHYSDFTDDPEDLPANADHLIVLQARYGDMTLLDYSVGPRPRVLIVDYDKAPGKDPVDLVFDDFDQFFATLRGERDRLRTETPRRDLGAPMEETPDDQWAGRFWGTSGPHAFYHNATQRNDGTEPRLAADDALVAATQDRLGLRLPVNLVALWRERNGGAVAARFVRSTEGAAARDVEVMRYPVPLEYMVTLAVLSDRIGFASSELPWGRKHPGAGRLVVLEADHERAVLLDYRDRLDDDPAVLVVDDLDRPLAEALRFERFDDLLRQLRFQRARWDDVSAPRSADLAEA